MERPALPNLLTADVRERRIVQFLVTLHRGRLAEFKLGRMNRLANFRKQLMQLINEMIETRAEDLAAGMLMEFAAPPPPKELPGVLEKAVKIRRRRLPVWPYKKSNRRMRRP